MKRENIFAAAAITGDLHVKSDTHVRNIRVDEYLEVPELKYNRITARLSGSMDELQRYLLQQIRHVIDQFAVEQVQGSVGIGGIVL